MKKNVKIIIWLVIGLIVGTSVVVKAATIFNSKDITYSSSATTKTNVKDSLDELYGRVGQCPEGNVCTETIFKIGDYVSMTPTSTSYTPPSSLTGCMNDAHCTQNTLNPSELKLWRVIKISTDGTVEMISDKVSSNTINFYGKTGYMNLIGGLNTIASKYTDGVHVQRTRHFGYGSQTEIITDTSLLNQDITSDSTPLMDEFLGAGDKGWVSDVNLAYEVYKSNIAYSLSGEAKNYWIASRYYYETNDERVFISRVMDFCGGVGGSPLIRKNESRDNFFISIAAIRPIVILSANVKIKSGDGKTPETAYTLE